MIDDEIINDLKKLINNDSIYHLITNTDIKKIINKYDNDYKDYLEKFNLIKYNEDGFILDLSNKTYEFNVNGFIRKSKKDYNKNVKLETIGYYKNNNVLYLYFLFGD